MASLGANGQASTWFPVGAACNPRLRGYISRLNCSIPAKRAGASGFFHCSFSLTAGLRVVVDRLPVLRIYPPGEVARSNTVHSSCGAHRHLLFRVFLYGGDKRLTEVNLL